MKIEEVNQSIIGRRVKGVFTATQVTGTIDKVTESEYTVEVHIILDKPVSWGDDEYTSYWSTARKCDGWGNLQHTEFIDNPDDLKWLKDYKPKSALHTSYEEIEIIAKKLRLDELTRQNIQQKRLQVLIFYSRLIDESQINGTTSENHDYNIALKSVMEAIDYIKSKRGMAV